MFEQFSKDMIKIINPDGTEFNNIKANVQTERIFVKDTNIVIQDGAEITRILPNGQEDRYLVIDNGYHHANFSIPAGYQCKVKKKSSYIEGLNSTKTNFTINATQSNINIANNHSQIHQITDNKIFQDIINQIEQSIQDHETKAQLIGIVKDLEKSIGTPSFKEKYNSLITSMANHITILAPFLPSLTHYFQ